MDKEMKTIKIGKTNKLYEPLKKHYAKGEIVKLVLPSGKTMVAVPSKNVKSPNLPEDDPKT